jgi:transcriptional regulator with XRE-family HTH domain
MACSRREHSASITTEVASRLRAERARRDMTLKDLERLTGIPDSTLHTFERGHRAPRADHLVLICSALGIEAADLLPVPSLAA